MLVAWSTWIKSKPAPATAIEKPTMARRRPIDKQIEKQVCFMLIASTLGFISLMYWLGFASKAEGSVILISAVFGTNILMSIVLFLSALVRFGQLHESRGVEIYKEKQK